MDIFDTFGIKLAALFAGAVGAIASLALEDGVSLRRGVVLVFTGAVTAGYLTPLIMASGLDDNLENSASFLVGLVSMKLLAAILDITEEFRRRPVYYLRKWLGNGKKV